MKNNQILLLIGLSILTLILYNRLFRVRLPKSFIQITNSSYYYIYIIIIISFIIMLLLSLFQLYKYLIDIKNKPNFLTENLKSILEHPYNPFKIISNSMIELDAFIKNKMPAYDDVYSYSEFITVKCAHIFINTKLKIIMLIIFMRIIPQIIVCISFAYDIIFNDKFNYFYKSLILLILPLIVQYIIYSITALIDTNLSSLNEDLDLRILPSKMYSKDTPLEYYEIVSIYEWRDILLSPQKEDYVCYNNLSQQGLDYFKGDFASAKYSLATAVDLMNTLFMLNKYILSYNEYKFIIEIPIKIIKYTIYIIGWSYIMFLYK